MATVFDTHSLSQHAMPQLERRVGQDACREQSEILHQLAGAQSTESNPYTKYVVAAVTFACVFATSLLFATSLHGGVRHGAHGVAIAPGPPESDDRRKVNFINLIENTDCSWERAFLVSLVKRSWPGLANAGHKHTSQCFVAGACALTRQRFGLRRFRVRHVNGSGFLQLARRVQSIYTPHNQSTVDGQNHKRTSLATLVSSGNLQRDMVMWTKICNLYDKCRGFTFDGKLAVMKAATHADVRSPAPTGHIVYEKPSHSQFTERMRQSGAVFDKDTIILTSSHMGCNQFMADRITFNDLMMSYLSAFSNSSRMPLLIHVSDECTDRGASKLLFPWYTQVNHVMRQYSGLQNLGVETGFRPRKRMSSFFLF